MSATIFENQNGTYGIKFYNPVTKTQSTERTVNTPEQAESFASKTEVDFYRDNTIYLPKGVYVSKNSFHLTVDTSQVKRGKHKILLGSAKRLNRLNQVIQ